MFDIGGGEFLVIAIVALIVIGPKELPGVLRMVGQWVGKARSMARDFQSQFQEAIREADVADMKKQFDLAAEQASALSPTNLLESANKDLNDALMKPLASGESATPEEAAVVAKANETKAAETTAATETKSEVAPEAAAKSS